MSESSMVERVAKAINEAQCGGIYQRQSDAAEAMARAAIASMREPTKAMLDAYLTALENPCDPRERPWHAVKARKRWEAMIGAALK